MKLWDKGIEINKMIEDFTVGNDRNIDLLLAEYDVMGSIAHSVMLHDIGVLSEKEKEKIMEQLFLILEDIRQGSFSIKDNVEDVHSQIEFILTEKLGNTGKKIHTGRSRNDQALTDIKMFLRDEVKKTVMMAEEYITLLLKLSEKYKDIFMPGYSHLQAAMPSSFGLWFGAYAESLTDDLYFMLAAYRLNNRNPLGSAAGYGSSVPVDRQKTTQLLGFEDMNLNALYAQMTRGKTEKITAFAISSVAATISRMASDICLFMCRNFDFIGFPDELTTGSSIMPHKQNPDVFELVRAKCNRIQSIPNEITIIVNNLTSGYFRDMQVLKEILFPAFSELDKCLNIIFLMLENIRVNKDILKNEIYDNIYSVEEVNKLVLKGIPFREAYKRISEDIRNGAFNPSKDIDHTHEGSIGNLCNDKIMERMNNIVNEFDFNSTDNVLKKLSEYSI